MKLALITLFSLNAFAIPALDHAPSLRQSISKGPVTYAASAEDFACSKSHEVCGRITYVVARKQDEVLWKTEIFREVFSTGKPIGRVEVVDVELPNHGSLLVSDWYLTRYTLDLKTGRLLKPEAKSYEVHPPIKNHEMDGVIVN